MKTFYEHHGVDEWEAAEWGLDEGPRRDSPMCKYCGEPIRWRQQGGKWVPFAQAAGVEHWCRRGVQPGEIPPIEE